MNYAKSFQGFKTRILANIPALTLVKFINKFILDRPINKIKNKQFNYTQRVNFILKS
jgi:hypothetical protein